MEFDPVSVFEKMPEDRFRDYQALETAVLRGFNSSMSYFPSGFTHRDLIRWGLHEGFVRQSEEGFHIVRL